ncbi:hypothetical protein GCM10009733_059780 [Nonomuraea maheshkhaliensis]|uniref:Alpha/beta hydrolase n=1 Tax=Nonomuraea maheshkhaliensis TaxID=419590 RepID=A0ABP4RII1_9ACTN
MTELTVVGYRQFREELRAARESLEARSRVPATACGRIEMAEEGAGPPVLVVHGIGGGFDQGLSVARAFAGGGTPPDCDLPLRLPAYATARGRVTGRAG